VELNNTQRLSGNEKEKQNANATRCGISSVFDAAGNCRDFMELHLPPELRAICDLSTLKLESGSFVEDDL
jgi:hypothetical protein